MEVPTQPYISTDHRTGNMTYQGKEQSVVEDYTSKRPRQNHPYATKKLTQKDQNI